MLSFDIRLKHDNFHLEVDLKLDHSVTGLFGPSASGKTSILSVISGLIHPQSGRVELDGQVLFDSRRNINIPPERRGIGYVFQNSQLFPHLSVKKNLLYGYHLVRSGKRRFSSNRIIDFLALGPLLSRRPRNLSGGEKQRVALGRALLTSPRFLLMDEPLSSMDEGLKSQILPFLKKVKDEINIPMIYVSHTIGEILQLTDRLVVLENGKVLGHGSFLEVMKEERILNLAKSLGLENVISGTVERHNKGAGITVVRINHHKFNLPISPSQSGEKVFISVRPEEIVLANRPVFGTSIQNQIEGKICRIVKVGNRALVYVDIGVIILAEITNKAVCDLHLKKGNRIYCLIKSRSFSYLGG